MASTMEATATPTANVAPKRHSTTPPDENTLRLHVAHD
jgi:hypothetical protein